MSLNVMRLKRRNLYAITKVLCNSNFIVLITTSRLRICFSVVKLPWSQRFSFAAKRDEKRERKKRPEKTSGSGRCECHYHATIGVNQHHEIV